MNEPITLKSTDTIHEDLHIDVGMVSISASIALVAVLIFILALKGKLPGLKFRKGDHEVSVGRQSDQGYGGPERRTGACKDALDPKAIQVTQLVARRRADAQNIAWALQKQLADEVEDEFWPLLDRRLVDPWQVETAWSRMHRVLYNAADQNHILDHVHGEQVGVDYLQEKVTAFRRRYEKLLGRTGCNLPVFSIIEEEVRSLLSWTLVRFARIADTEEAKLAEFVESIKATTDNHELKSIIDTLARRVPEEEA